MAKDDFEARFMRGDAPVRHRDKRISRTMAAILAAPALFVFALAVFVGVTNSSADKPVPPSVLPFVLLGLGLFGVMYLVLALTFAVLRTVVTDHAVVVKYGLWGPTVPLESIVGCRVIDYQWTKFGGWGIRRGADGTWAYVPASGEVVELRFTEGGKEKRVLIGAENPRALAAEIQRAQEKAPLRIDAQPAVDDEQLAEAEAAEEEEEARRRT